MSQGLLVHVSRKLAHLLAIAWSVPAAAQQSALFTDTCKWQTQLKILNWNAGAAAGTQALEFRVSDLTLTPQDLGRNTISLSESVTAIVEACTGDKISVRPDARGPKSLAVLQVGSEYKVAPFWVRASRPGLLQTCFPNWLDNFLKIAFVWACPWRCGACLRWLLVRITLYHLSLVLLQSSVLRSKVASWWCHCFSEHYVAFCVRVLFCLSPSTLGDRVFTVYMCTSHEHLSHATLNANHCHTASNKLNSGCVGSR